MRTFKTVSQIIDNRLLFSPTSPSAPSFSICPQEADRHTEAINVLTEYLGIGSYKEWTEDKKLEFLVSELRGKRPLIPNNIELSEPVAEVLDTFKIAAELGTGSLGAYVISMASEVSGKARSVDQRIEATSLDCLAAPGADFAC